MNKLIIIIVLYFKTSRKIEQWLLFKTWKGTCRSFSSRGKAKELIPLHFSILSGISCGIRCAWPWGGLELDTAQEMLWGWLSRREARGKGNVAEQRCWSSRGGGMEHPLLCGSNRRFMEIKLCPETGLWGKHGLFLWLWKAPGGWKHSSTYLFFCIFPCFQQTFLQTSVLFLYSLICCGHGQAAPSDSTNFQGVENQKLINNFFIMTSLTI